MKNNWLIYLILAGIAGCVAFTVIDTEHNNLAKNETKPEPRYLHDRYPGGKTMAELEVIWAESEKEAKVLIAQSEARDAAHRAKMAKWDIANDAQRRKNDSLRQLVASQEVVRQAAQQQQLESQRIIREATVATRERESQRMLEEQISKLEARIAAAEKRNPEIVVVEGRPSIWEQQQQLMEQDRRNQERMNLESRLIQEKNRRFYEEQDQDRRFRKNH